MDIKDVKTMTGLTMADAITKLDEQLPADAYSAVPGGADLTDIDPNYMRKTLNEVFGLCGFGWGYEYVPTDMETRQETRKTQSGTREVIVAVLKHLRFWYKVSDGSGEVTTCTVDASGGSDNSSPSYAMKGAITNAIGNAASNIGFQASVYLGKRSHKTVKAPAKAAAPVAKAAASKPAPAKAVPATTNVKTTPIPAAPAADEIEEISGEPAAAPLVDDFIIQFGTRKGQKLADQQLNVIQWYADQMTTGGDAAKDALKEAAQAIVAVRSNGHQPQTTAA